MRGTARVLVSLDRVFESSSHRQEKPMENTARLFNCARCHRQVVICRRCDRGNIYCGPGCSYRSRHESRRAAARRYQRSRRGRMAHAKRQRRYRSRVRKVTHQGSTALSLHDSLASVARIGCARSGSSPTVRAQHLVCGFCNRLCAPFVRLDFLHSPGPRSIASHKGRPLPHT